MTNRITHADINVERDSISGAVTCSAMVDGERVAKRYFGHTLRSARADFYRTVNDQRTIGYR